MLQLFGMRFNGHIGLVNMFSGTAGRPTIIDEVIHREEYVEEVGVMNVA